MGRHGFLGWIAAIALLTAPLATRAAGTGDEDVLGRSIPQADGRPTVVLYANKDNEKQLGTYALPLLYRLREEAPRVIVKVDLSDVPGIFHGVARKRAKDGFDRSLRDMRDYFAAKGETPPADMQAQFFLVADMEGKAHRALGLPEGFETPVIQALGSDGRELARGKLPSTTQRVEQALRQDETLARIVPPPLGTR